MHLVDDWSRNLNQWEVHMPLLYIQYRMNTHAATILKFQGWHHRGWHLGLLSNHEWMRKDGWTDVIQTSMQSMICPKILNSECIYLLVFWLGEKVNLSGTCNVKISTMVCGTDQQHYWILLLKKFHLKKIMWGCCSGSSILSYEVSHISSAKMRIPLTLKVDTWSWRK